MNAVKTMLLLAALTAGLVWMGGLLGGRTGAAIAFVVALAMNAGSYWFSDRIVLARYSAREATPSDEPLVVAPLAATLVRLAVSRTREYGADDAAARVTQNPEGLANALEKLGQASGRIPLAASPATSHLFIVKPALAIPGIQALFSTHPPLERRIARLRGMPRS